MITLTLRPLPGGLVEVSPSGFNPAVRDQFRTVPGARWERERRAYIAPVESLDTVLKTLEKAKVARIDRRALDAIRVTDRASGRWRPLPSELRPYQTTGVNFLRETLEKHSAAILADEMGLGKTAQAILSCAPGKRALIVCPAIVATHWADEIKKWAGEAALVWTGTKKPKLAAITDDVRWLVMSYDMFRRTWQRRTHSQLDDLPLVDQVVLDELHYLGSSKSLRSKAVRDYLSACQRPRVIGLTGTPITAWLENLHNPLDLLFPGRFGTWWQFTARYCGGRFEPIVAKNGSPVLDAEGLPRRAWRADGVSNLEELRARLSHFFIRRTKADSGIELPPRIRTTIPVDLPAGARTELRALMRDVRSPDAIRRALAGVEVYKLDAAVELAEELRAAGNRVLLGTCRIKHAQEIASRLNCPCVDGSVDATERKARLLDGGRATAAVATMFSVTEGIDLTYFDSLIYVGLDWVPKTMLQFGARLHRPGQKRTVNEYYLIGRPSIDEHIRKVVVDRLETFSEVLGAASTKGERELASDLEDRADLIGQIVSMIKETT